MKKTRTEFSWLLFFSALILMSCLFAVRPADSSVIRGTEKVFFTERERSFLFLVPSFHPLLGQRGFSAQDDKPMEDPTITIAKKFRLRRHPDGEASNLEGGRQQERLGQTIGPQPDPEDIPGIEFDSHGRPKTKEPGQKDEPLPRPGLQPPSPLPNSSGEMPVLNEPIPSRR